MDCEEIEETEIAEKYVTGQLDDIEQAEFETHFVACQRCFQQVQLLQDMQAALAPRPSGHWRWLAISAIAASLLVAAGVTWLRLRPVSEREAGQSAASSGTHFPARPTLDLTALAMVSPPRYSQPRWRAAGQTGFDLAMQHYARGDYAGATPGLLAVLEGDPGNSAAGFFLGICYLMQGRDDEAIKRLRATIALQDSPELEEAHFYLAKALLRKQDISGAIAELRQAIALHGSRQPEERSLLESLNKETPPAQ
ncbi:MAG: tetratricopeptide repeat protein [Bryobacteraceae bacterium]